MSNPQEFVLHINSLGELVFVYADELADLLAELSTLSGPGGCLVARASHVEPVRTSSGKIVWVADMSPMGGPKLGGFRTRADAIIGELIWLEENLV